MTKQPSELGCNQCGMKSACFLKAPHLSLVLSWHTVVFDVTGLRRPGPEVISLEVGSTPRKITKMSLFSR